MKEHRISVGVGADAVKASACSTGHDPWYLGHKLGTAKFAEICRTDRTVYRVYRGDPYGLSRQVCLSLLQGRRRSQEGPGSQ